MIKFSFTFFFLAFGLFAQENKIDSERILKIMKTKIIKTTSTSAQFHFGNKLKFKYVGFW